MLVKVHEPILLENKLKTFKEALNGGCVTSSLSATLRYLEDLKVFVETFLKHAFKIDY